MCFSVCRLTLLPMRCCLLMVAHVTGLQAGEFVHTFGDVHLYKNHVEQATFATATRAPYPIACDGNY